MNYVKAKVVANDKNLYIPVKDGSVVSFADKVEIEQALGLDDIKNPLVCGYLEMYEYDDKNKQILPVRLNSQFLIGPKGAHLNISGISGLASKTSYAMFLMKAIQEEYLKKEDDSVAFVMLNVKGRDLLAIDEINSDLNENDKKLYEMLGLSAKPFENVNYYYPYSRDNFSNTYHSKEYIQEQKYLNKAYTYKFTYEHDKENLDLLFANIDDPTQTMDSIVNFIISGQGKFSTIEEWETFKNEINEYCQAGNSRNDKEITVSSWRKFKRIVNKSLNNPIFADRIVEGNNEIRLQNVVKNIKTNEIKVIDIAKLDENMQGFVFGDVMRAIYDLKLGQFDEEREEDDIPNKIVIFIDELNKYASTDIPKSSPILRQIIDIAERGRSLGIILFSAEQFKSAIHDRVKGNASTHAYGRTNAIEVSKKDYTFIPQVYKGMMTRLKQGEYVIQNPIFRSLLNIKFPKPIYKQFK
ncbi:MAG: ATP-binding protein [Campylobacterota bacterium]